MKFHTLCIHAGHSANEANAHLTPIYASSTYIFNDAAHAENLFTGKEKGYIYGRFGNPTINEAQQRVAALEAYQLKNERGESLQLSALLHASGMGAITTLFLSQLKSGDAIITHESLYGGTHELLDKILPDLNINFHLVDFQNMQAIEKCILEHPEIKMMYLETPANPTLQCVDLSLCISLAKKYSLLTAVDNTFTTPYLQQPFAFGADFVVHSTTKYLNGHGTAVGGILIGHEALMNSPKVIKTHRLLGANSNAWDAFLLVNGLRTLPLRMKQHTANAQVVAEFLHAHPLLKVVKYLGLPNHPHFDLAASQMRSAGAMMSCELKGGWNAARVFLNNLKLCTHAVSLGTCDTLISHPASTTHAGVPKDVRDAAGITDGLLRISVGLEDVEDIIADLDQALNCVD